jgi:hypothetical protein
MCLVPCRMYRSPTYPSNVGPEMGRKLPILKHSAPAVEVGLFEPPIIDLRWGYRSQARIMVGEHGICRVLCRLLTSL